MFYWFSCRKVIKNLQLREDNCELIKALAYLSAMFIPRKGVYAFSATPINFTLNSAFINFVLSFVVIIHLRKPIDVKEMIPSSEKN